MSRLLGVLGVGEVDVRDQVWGVGGTPVTSSRLQYTAVPGTIDLIGKLSVKKNVV